MGQHLNYGRRSMKLSRFQTGRCQPLHVNFVSFRPLTLEYKACNGIARTSFKDSL